MVTYVLERPMLRTGPGRRAPEPPAQWRVNPVRGSHAMVFGVFIVVVLIGLSSVVLVPWKDVEEDPLAATGLVVAWAVLLGTMGLELARRRRLQREERVLGYVIRFDREGLALRSLPAIRWADLEAMALQQRARGKGKQPFLVLGLDEAAFAAVAPAVSRETLRDVDLETDAFRRELAFNLHGLEDRPEDILRMARRFHAHHTGEPRA